VSVTYAQLLDRVITDGIAAARADYADDPYKLQGAVEGFMECCGKQPSEIVALYKSAEDRCAQARREHAADYWSWRCRALEIEWVLNVLSAGLYALNQPPLLGHLPTARALMKYVEIVGISDGHGKDEAP
jgi:hypothetical protein